MTRLSTLALTSVLLLACGGDDASDESGAGATTSGEPQDTDGGDTTETGETDPVCLPDGTYGPCSSNLCQCVLGGDVYQTCTIPCTDTSQCGDPADFPGATPDCAPVNAGDPNMICMLRCNTSADCPCGLECESTVKICAEPQ